MAPEGAGQDRTRPPRRLFHSGGAHRGRARARLGKGGAALDAVDAALPGARLAQAVELVGLADAALDMAVDYAKNRVAFGHPIGSYQAIRHKCADMVADLDQPAI